MRKGRPCQRGRCSLWSPAGPLGTLSLLCSGPPTCWMPFLRAKTPAAFSSARRCGRGKEARDGGGQGRGGGQGDLKEPPMRPVQSTQSPEKPTNKICTWPLLDDAHDNLDTATFAHERAHAAARDRSCTARRAEAHKTTMPMPGRCGGASRPTTLRARTRPRRLGKPRFDRAVTTNHTAPGCAPPTRCRHGRRLVLSRPHTHLCGLGLLIGLLIGLAAADLLKQLHEALGAAAGHLLDVALTHEWRGCAHERMSACVHAWA
jgi:hypothetical protein